MKPQKEKTETLKIPESIWQRMFDISMEISPDKKNLLKPLPILAIAINHLHETAHTRGVAFVSQKEFDDIKGEAKESASKHLN